jgi:F0F1-type ATP synthase delta subunit
MVVTDEIIAQKYATAFCNVYGETLTEDFIDRLCTFASVISLRRGILIYLMLKTLTHDQKEHMIQRLMQHYSLGLPFRHLVVMLYRHRRLALLNVTIKKITKLYWKRRAVAMFSVALSHDIKESEKKRIVDFVRRRTHADAIKVDFMICPELISGIRIKGDAWLWERSIRALLRDVKRSMLQRVGL